MNSSLWHADYSFVDTEDQPNSSFACQAAFQLLAGQAREVRNASCTPTAQLFFQLHGPGDPLNVSKHCQAESVAKALHSDALWPSVDKFMAMA